MSTVLVDLDVCVKTGEVTNQRVTLRGQTRPAWVTVLLLFTIVGFLPASAMTSRSYRITVPFTHRVHDRWIWIRRWAWAVRLAGVGVLITPAFTSTDAVDPWLWTGVVLIVTGLVVGETNAFVNTVGIRLTRDEELVVTRAHPAIAQAARAAVVEPLPDKDGGARR